MSMCNCVNIFMSIIFFLPTSHVIYIHTFLPFMRGKHWTWACPTHTLSTSLASKHTLHTCMNFSKTNSMQTRVTSRRNAAHLATYIHTVHANRVSFRAMCWRHCRHLARSDGLFSNQTLLRSAFLKRLMAEHCWFTPTKPNHTPPGIELFKTQGVCGE